MKRPPIYYINRHRLPQYHSIEELFGHIHRRITQKFTTRWITLPRPGASPCSLLSNLMAVIPQKHCVYHITGDVNYMALRLGKQSILTIHDVKSALKGPFWKQYIIRQLWFRWPARRVKFITVISEFSKQELAAVIPKQAHKIKVIYNPVPGHLTPDHQKEFNTQRPHVLLMGTKSNKNLEGSLNALKGMEVKLIIIGKLQMHQHQTLEAYGLRYNNYTQLTYKEVISCYQKADILCFPSFYEGFGMPIIEAQALGKPVITSNLGAMKEVAADSACLVDPYDTLSIKKGVEKVIRNKDYRESLVSQGMENVKRFSFEKITNQYLDLYLKLMV